MSTSPVVDLICRHGSQKFQDKSITVEPGKPISLARCAKDGDKVYNGLFCAPVVSRSHAEVHYENGKFFLNDLGSVNGLDFNDSQFSERCDVDGSFFNSDAILIIFWKGLIVIVAIIFLDHR